MSNGLIAFSGGSLGGPQIAVMGSDGSHRVTITSARVTPRHPYPAWEPAWSPDGSQIAFRGFWGHGETSDLFVMKADGSNTTQLTREANVSDPAWSPDGTTIAVSGFDGIYTIDADGGALSRITPESRLWHNDPSWSPDGTRIAYDRLVHGIDQIFIIGVDGTGDHQITDMPSGASTPSWSPDGTGIAFNGDLSGTADIYLMNIEGSDVRPIATCDAPDCTSESHPTWAPDGSRIAFDRNSAGRTAIYTARPDGSDLMLVAMNAFDPAWQPIPTPASSSVDSPDAHASPQYSGHIESAVGDGSDLWLVTCTKSCGHEHAGGTGTIRKVSSAGGVITPGYATPVGDVGVLAHDGADLFALDFSAETVTRLREDTGDVVWTTDLQRTDTQTPGTVFVPEYVTASGESVWVSSAAGGIAQLDRATGQLLHVLILPPESTGDVAWGAGSLWVSEALAGIWHLTREGHIIAKVRVTDTGGRVLQVGSVAATPEGVWVTGDWARPFVDALGTSGYVATDTFALALIDPATDDVVFSANLPQGVAMTVIDDALWLIRADGHTVYHADGSGITPVPLALDVGECVLAVTSAGAWISDVDGLVFQPFSLSR